MVIPIFDMTLESNVKVTYTVNFITARELLFHFWTEGLGGSVVVDFLFIVTLIVVVCNCSMFCCTLFYSVLVLQSS